MKIINPIRQAGFTLVELIIVIVILGILSAFAVPKFIDVTTDARAAAIEGIAGSMRSAASIVHAGYVSAGSTGTTVSMSDGSTVTLANGYPAAAQNGILDAVGIAGGETGDVTCTGSPMVCTIQTDCKVTYTAATTSAAPTIVPVITGC